MDIINTSNIDYYFDLNNNQANSNCVFISIIKPVVTIVLTLDSIIINNTANTNIYNIKIFTYNSIISRRLIKPDEVFSSSVIPNEVLYVYYEFKKNDIVESIYCFIKK